MKFQPLLIYEFRPLNFTLYNVEISNMCVSNVRRYPSSIVGV